ncbi:MAG: proline--tRNA ligase [Thaumarchaeota archaeon]|nr:proline--tRNA ligase [Nitrososphaerota archaeon]
MSSPKTEGMTAKKSENFDEWYTQVILRSEIADYGPVSGCMVFRPSGYALWESVQKATDAEFRKLGVQNTYFPLFIPERLLKKEAEHVEGFSPEVAWVTEAGNSKLEERLAIRPTSETVMYEVVSRWIRSWRDLPLKLNQWNNVVRWEFSHPTPFLRSREFLWNEGHTLFATKEAADDEKDEILGIYKMVTEEYLSLPGYVGRKTDQEKFAGAEASYSIEYLLPDGKAIQGPDFHSDGQRFSKAFEIVFVDEKGEKQFAWQNTWAISTRVLGVMLAVHGDDRGAVLPPMVAQTQVVVVPIVNDENKEEVLAEARKVAERLGASLRVRLDERDHLTPGRKFNEWELKGVPLRVEIGPRDLKASQAVLVRRDSGTKRSVKLSEIVGEAKMELDEIGKALFQKAKGFLAENTREASSLRELESGLKEKGGIYRILWCGRKDCEDDLRKSTGGKILNMPLGQGTPKGRCIFCGEPAKTVANFAKSY